MELSTLIMPTLVQKHKSTGYVPLIAECVDFPTECGKVSPLPFLPDELQKQIRDPSAIFPDGVSHLPKCPRFSGSRAEYILLVRRQLRVLKVRLSLECQHAAPIFAVKK
jgi:hypothetical protein